MDFHFTHQGRRCRKRFSGLGLRQRALLLAAALSAILLATEKARALDPNRALTQAVHRIWQVAQGLPHATVFAVWQTQDGYLWLGTQTGLVRFDGIRFTSVREVGGVSLENIWVEDLVEDAGHSLWIATDGAGLIRLQNGTGRRYGISDGLPSEHVHSLRTDRHGDLWIGTANGLARFSQEHFTVFRKEQGLAMTAVRAVCEGANGLVWVGGDGAQLSVWDGVSFTTHPLASVPAGAVVNDLATSEDGAIWVGTSSGLVRLKDGIEKRWTAAEGLADDAVLCLATGQGGTLWVGTRDGFSRVRNEEIENFRQRNGLSQSTVYTLCEDREGSLWVGTKLGLNQFFDGRLIPFTANEGLPSNDTGPILQDGEGTTWVGTLGAGLGRFDGRRISALTTKEGLAGATIRALSDDGEGGLWAGTDSGLARMRDGRVVQAYTTAQGLPSDAIRCLVRDKKGTLWAGTAQGIAALRDGRFVTPDDPPPPLRGPVIALVDHSTLGLLAAVEGGGLYAYADGKFKQYTPDPRSPANIDAFFEDKDGLLWIGTAGGGLHLLDGAATFNFSMRDGLYDDEIYGIVGDDQDRLWMACSKGIFYVPRAQLRKLATREIKAVTSTPFSPTDAQRTIECKPGVQPAAWRMRDGRIWFSTTRGVIVLDPSRLQRGGPSMPVLIDEVIVNGRSERPGLLRSLPPGNTNLEFHYAALTLLAPNRVAYRYQLEGFDKDWVQAGARREAFYNNLAPGNYRFRVSAQKFDEPWIENEAPVAFTLAPYLYQRRWFFPLCGLLLAGVVWLGYRARVRRIREHLHAIVAERSRIARELHDTLMQGFSGVTMEMQALSSRLPESQERGTLEEIIRDAGTCLREARQSIAGLRRSREANSGLAAAISQAARQITETRSVRLKLDVGKDGPTLAPEVEYNLLRIAQEAVTNAVKHSGARTIDVALNGTPQALRLTIKDDGSGIPAENGAGPGPGHYGLIGMRERATQIGADLRLVSEPGRGTAVYVLFPTGKTGGASPMIAVGSESDRES
ncbi:MAG TPA: two-component regulator propeller domain-containing protein [Tepidisphaeraceae bacterium]|jgi:signal transduction histidine kinase/ligand-binding sensor domain-containing protein|nr:two-component regulator propeller domain-containing protein [Tepidisphaeraceae bacterium]